MNLNGKTVTVRGWRGVAFDVIGYSDSGHVKAVMVGDDRVHYVDEEDCVVIDEGDYCSECGQIGCGNGNKEE